MSRPFKNLIHCICFNLSILIASSQYWQQSVDYDMKVTLIDSVRQLACSSTIMYKNNSPDQLNDIFIHLYPNAFQLGSVKSRDYLNGYGRESRAAYFKDGLDGYKSKIHVRNLTIAKNDKFISDHRRTSSRSRVSYCRRALGSVSSSRRQTQRFISWQIEKYRSYLQSL